MMLIKITKRLLLIMLSPLFLLACQQQDVRVYAGGKSLNPALVSAVTGHWRLYQTLDSDTVWSVPDDSDFTLLLGEGKASGLVACNQWRSQAQVSEGKLVLGPAITSRMRCSSQDANVESFSMLFLQQLNQGMKVIEYNVDAEEKVLLLETENKQKWFFKAL